MADFITGLPLAVVLLVAPGLALLLWLLPDQDVDWFEWLSLSGGLGLAVFPLLLLWARVIGDVQLGSLALWAVLGICLLLIFWRLIERRDIRRALRDTPLWFSLLLILTAGVVLGVRLIAIRGLAVPLWGDSVQHAVIAQLLVDNGGLFDSWLPYAPYQSLTVHFGFHAAVAAFQWVTGMEAAQATLYLGQIINALSVFTLYPLAMRVTGGKRWAGIGTLWAVGVLSPMPAFYVNWGRYPQLAGQAILPVALWLLIAAIDSDRGGWRVAVLAGVSAAGMSLTYYRMPFYYGVFLLIWLAVCGFVCRWNGKKWLSNVARLAVVGGVAVLLMLPWVWHVAQSKVATGAAGNIVAAGPSPLRQIISEYLLWLQITTYFPWWFLVIAGIAWIWSIARRQWTVAGLGLWIAALALLRTAGLLNLPGAAFIQVFAIIIALYIPVGILIGWLLSEVISWLLELRPVWGYVGVFVVLAIGLGWGLMHQINIVDADYVMVTDPDLAAMDWIQANTPEDARFLVNGFSINGGRSAVGSDAGWWIPLLANRQNTMPPQYALQAEAPIDPAYNQDVVTVVAQLQEAPLTSPAVLSTLCQQGISHVYVGQGQGRVGLTAVPLFLPDELSASPVFSPLYHQDQVWVFAFDSSICPAENKDPG